MGISVLIKIAPVAKLLTWQQYLGCHFISLVMLMCGAKFQEHCFNISRDIVYSIFYHFLVANIDGTTYLICIIENTSETKKIFRKEKHCSVIFLRGLSNKQKLFFVSFKKAGDLLCNKETTLLKKLSWLISVVIELPVTDCLFKLTILIQKQLVPINF